MSDSPKSTGQPAPANPRLASAQAVTAVKRKPALDFSMTGLIYSGMMLFMGLAAINSQANLLFGVFGLMVGILLVSSVVSRLVLKRLSIRRLVPDHGVVGRPMAITYEFENKKRRWPSLSVCLSELDGNEAFTTQPQCYLLHVAPGMTASVPAEVVPKRRGLHELDQYQVSTSFPFGFVKRARPGRHKDRVLILPAIGQVDGRLLSLCKSAEDTGAAMRPQPGGADEFYGVREYRQGDSPRSIYWRRSARTGVLVLKEMTRVSPPRLLLLVDTHLADRSPEAHTRVEHAIAMAGSLASKALEDGLAVGLCAWSGPGNRDGANSDSGNGDGGGDSEERGTADLAGGWVGIHPNRGKRHRDDLLSVLARLPLNTTQTTENLLDQGRRMVKTGTTSVLLTPRDMPSGLSDRSRGGTVVVSSHPGSGGTAWFTFDPEVRFAFSMPPDQQPGARLDAAGRAHAARRKRRASHAAVVLILIALVIGVAAAPAVIQYFRRMIP